MRTQVGVDIYGTPVAIKNVVGEWVEVGYITASDLTVDQEEWMEWEPLGIRRPQREYRLSLDINANESVWKIMREIAQWRR